MKFKKLLIVLAIMVSIMFGFGQTDYAKGSFSSGHSSFSSHSSYSSHSSSSVKSGSFSSPKSTMSTSSKSTTTSKPSTSTKPTSSTKSGSFSTSTKSSAKSSTTRYTKPASSSYHYTPNSSTVHNTYISNSGSSYQPSFWDNYFLYRAISGENTGTIATASGARQNVNYGTSGIWKDVLTIIVIGGVITGVVIFIKRRR